MSGHSKWSTIKHKKAKVDAQRGVAFAKFSREIIVATKLGGKDPGSNFRLRTAIEKAKAAGLPNENIKRAIEKGAKSTAESDNFEELTYEGYGSGGVAVFVEALTDNKNRTAGDIRSYFTKFNGNLGETGCVGWMFEKFGEIVFEKDIIPNFDDLFEAAIEANANDVFEEDDDEEDIDNYGQSKKIYKVLCSSENLQQVVHNLEQKGFKPKRSQFVRIAQNSIEIDDEKTAIQILRLMENLENHDDVQSVYSNFEFSDSVQKLLDL